MVIDEIISKIRHKTESYFSHQLDFLSKLISFDSGTGNLEGNKNVVDLIAQFLERLPATVTTVTVPEVGCHLIAKLGQGGSRKILCLAHLDTVFGPGQAQQHPFRIEGPRAYGLGIADCKGGVAVSLFGLLIAHELGLISPDLEIALLYTCDEETGSKSSKALFETESSNAGCAFVFEPARAENGLITSRKGCAYGSLVAAGQEAHAGNAYLKGVDANLGLAKTLVELSRYNIPDKELFFNAGTIQGGRRADVVSEFAKSEFFVTFGSSEDLDYIANSLKCLENKELVSKCQVSSHLEVYFPPMPRTPGNVRAYESVANAGALLGMELPEQSSAGSSDACWCSYYGMPVIDGLGPYMFDIHTKNESLLLDSLKSKTELFALVLCSFLPI
jgi:glutamate carboxypeptidase